MATLQEKIQQASARNSELVAELHQIGDAPSQLYQQLNYMRDLDSQIAKSEKAVKDTTWRSKIELMDHKKYSESTFNRLAHKASGRGSRFAEKAAKEEREYFDAMQAQKTAEDDLAYIRQLRSEAEIQKGAYEKSAQRYELLQFELDAMYHSIFSGPTPGFPDEDAKEQAVSVQQQITTQVSQAYEAQKHVLFLLDQLSAKLTEASKHLAEAHGYSSFDMFSVADAFSAFQKRNALERAESAMSSVRMLQEQIRGINPNVAELGDVNIALVSMLGDVVFDNVVNDLDLHDKIKNSEEQVRRAIERFAQNRRLAEQRAKEVEGDFRAASETLKTRRKELQSAREEAFRRVGNGEALPQRQTGMYQGGAGAVQWQSQAIQDAPPVYSAYSG